MKLLFENWRKYLNEEEYLLEEGWKDWVMAGLMGLSALTAPSSPALAAEPAPTAQVRQSYFADSLSAEQKILIRGALYLFTDLKKIKGTEEQDILKAAWALQSPKDSTPETDKYLKAVLEFLKEDPSLAETYLKAGKRVKVLERIERGYIKKTGEKTQRVERTVYAWGNAR